MDRWIASSRRLLSYTSSGRLSRISSRSDAPIAPGMSGGSSRRPSKARRTARRIDAPNDARGRETGTLGAETDDDRLSDFELDAMVDGYS